MNNNTANQNTISILIPDGESRLAVLTLQCLSVVPNLKLYVLANSPFVPVRFSRYMAGFFTYPKEEGEKVYLEAIYNIAKEIKADIILPVDQPAIRLLSKHRKRFSELTALSPLPELEAFDIAANKWRLANWLKKNDLPTPTTLLYQNNEQFAAELVSLSFPVLLKPTHECSGHGIKIFDTPAELFEHFKRERVTLEEYIIQPFLTGYDIGCNILSQNGKILAHTIQKEFTPSQQRFEPAACVDFVDEPMVYKVIEKLAEKLNWSGVANIDLRYDEKKQQVTILEINPRFWASLQGSLAAGVNFPYLACLAGLKRDFPDVTLQPIRYAKAKMAIKILFQRIFLQNKSLYFDGSELKYALKNPGPMLCDKYLSFKYKFKARFYKVKK